MAIINPVRAWRLEQGLTQRQAASLIPVTRTTWARWETGARQVAEELLPQVSKQTGIPKRNLRPDLAELMGAQ